MSLFKTRDAWTTVIGENETFDTGCLCLADLDNSGHVGSYSGFLRVYEPSILTKKDDSGGDKKLETSEDLMCEIILTDPVLQVEAGRFVSGLDKLTVLVLCSKKVAVYRFTSQVTSEGVLTQCSMTCAYEHRLKRNAFNLCYGSFGGVVGKDFICVQSLDGTISIFEQEVFTFSRFLPNSLLPGPLKYISSLDAFLTASSCRQVECYKMQTLALVSEKASKSGDDTGKKVLTDWIFATEDNTKDISVLNESIFVLGERNLYALSDQGQLIFMKKFDFEPSSFLVYVPDDGSKNVNFLITTCSKTLLVYHKTTMQWAAQLNYIPVQITRALYKKYQGLIVTLDETGHLCCSYLGTNPSLFSRKIALDQREFDFSAAQKELKQLQQIIKDKQHLSGPNFPKSTKNVSEELKLTLTARNFEKCDSNIETELEEGVPSLSVNIALESPMSLKNIKLSLNVFSPLAVTQQSFLISHLDSNHPLEKRVKVFMKQQILPTSLNFTATTSYQNNEDKYRIQSDALPCLWIVVEDFISRLKKYSPSTRLSFNHQQILMDDFFHTIEQHFLLRLEGMKLSKSLEENSIQFIAIQKRLLIIFKDKTPTPFSNLDILLEMTHRQIVNIADKIEQNGEDLLKISSQLSCSVNIINLLFQLSLNLSQEDFNILHSALTPDVSMADASVGWEELVECNITHLLRTSLSKNVKDVVVNPASMACMQDTEKLKKHISVLFERLIKGARLSDRNNGSTPDKNSQSEDTNFISEDYNGKAKRKISKSQHRKQALESLNEEMIANEDAI